MISVALKIFANKDSSELTSAQEPKTDIERRIEIGVSAALQRERYFK
jgi:hypothetical protein